MNAEEFEDILSRTHQEGFDYAFIHYSDFKEIKDKEFHKLRKNYIDARNKLAKYINFKD